MTLIETELARVESQIDHIDRLLSAMPKEDRKLVTYTLIDGNTYRQAEDVFYITYSAIARKVDRILDNASRCIG